MNYFCNIPDNYSEVDILEWTPSEPFTHCLYRFTDNYSTVLIFPVVCTNVIGRYFNACNTINSQNILRRYELAIEKHWAKQSGYFGTATSVELGVETQDVNITFFYII